jgi:hypothetical protein
MTNYQRNFIAGGRFFLTVNLVERKLRLLTEHIDELRAAFREIVNFAQQNGLNLLEVGATRPICSSCASLITGAGATPVTPLKVP